MRKFFYLVCLSTAIVGCNNTTTTSGTRVSPTSGETVTKKLTLTAAKDQTISRNGSDKITISVKRENFNDPVSVALTGLPAGVAIVEKEMSIGASKDSVTLTLNAAADAAVGDHQVTITADAPGMPRNSQTFKLTVK
jgi:hypothetical protein